MKHPKELINELKFLSSLKKSLDNKDLLLAENTINISSNYIFINLKIFFKTQKVIKYKKKFIKSKINLKIKKKKFNHLLTDNFKIFNNTKQVVNITNLNKNIVTKDLKSIYLKVKRFKNILFAKRFNLFIDFIKVTSLTFNTKLSPTMYLNILSKIFKFLKKKEHTKFIMLLKLLFKKVIKKKSSLVKGVLFKIKGKLKGKTRASEEYLLMGSMPRQSFQKNIKFSKTHVFTLYGVFGFKIWINYN